MIKWNKSLAFKVLAGVLMMAGVSSCQMFENDVADFMEKYTETAAIETHEFNVETYDDALSQLCISSEEDTQISLYMRNPKQFTLIPSVTFPQLSSSISTATVDINQTDKQTIMLSLPQSFLVPADEGNNITAEIRLYEPMSGRDFDRYKVNLHCNTIPPQILNPTIMNDNGYFVICFDMPNPEEVAVRHTDISELVINGTSYPVQIPTPEEDTASDIPGIMIVDYGKNYDSSDPSAPRLFPNSRFTKPIIAPATSATCTYSVLGGKTFTPNKNSFYFATNEPLIAGDKEYTIELKDAAGLTATSLASTSISKLNKPVVRSVDPVTGVQTELSGEGIIGVPYDEDTEKGIITITPPTADHKGYAVSGAIVHYRIYEATGTGRLYTSGTTTTTKTIELPQNTYRVEAYATRTNYEQSSTESLKIRLMNNVLYVRAATSGSDVRFSPDALPPDGSATSPFLTISDALLDINNPDRDRKPKYTIYIDGDFTNAVYTGSSTQSEDSSINMNTEYETDELVLAKWPGAVTAKLKSISVGTICNLDKIKYGDITLSNSSNILMLENYDIQFEIDGTTIEGTGASAKGILFHGSSNTQNSIKNCTISGCQTGIYLEDAGTHANHVTIQNATITSCQTGISSSTSNGSTVTVNSASISASSVGITIYGGTLTIENAQITGAVKGILPSSYATINLNGGSITGNQIGIEMPEGVTLKVKGAPIVYNNLSTGSPAVQQNIFPEASLTDNYTITVDGALRSGCHLGVTTVGAPSQVGDPLQEFTTGFRANNPTAMPSSFFSSDAGLSVVLSADGQAGLVVAGASGEDMYTASDYSFSFAVADAAGISATAVYPGMTKTLKITPTITRPGTSSPVTLHYNSADRKLYTSAGFETGTVCANGNAITWSGELYNSSRKIATLSSSDITAVSGEEAINVKVSIPENPGSYILKLYANFLGMPHSVSCSMTSATKAINAAAAIASYTSGNHNVTVTDPVSPADLMAVANALRTHTSDNVGINLDASGTTNANSNLNDYALPAYDSGAYFLDCTALKSMKLPNWMEGILPGLFRNSGITSVEIPDSVDLISAHAFYGCTGLTTITIPAAVTEIGASAFQGCSGLATINFAGTKEQWGQITRRSNWHNGIPATTTQVHCLADNQYCPLDYIELVTTTITVPGTTTSANLGTSGSIVLNGRNLKIPYSENFTKLIASDHEVTQYEYEQYMTYFGRARIGEYQGASGSSEPWAPVDGQNSKGYGPNYPANYVSWYEAVMYCNLRSAAEHLTPAYYIMVGDEKVTDVSEWDNMTPNITCYDGKYFYDAGFSNTSVLDYIGPSDSDGGIQMDPNADGWRLPTEVEWEYLARGGNMNASSQLKYSGTDSDDDLKNYAWYVETPGVGETAHEVKRLEPNALELYDMSGNISEWCWDWWASNSNINDSTPATGISTAVGSEPNRAIRGGSWGSNTTYCEVSKRDNDCTYTRSKLIGFRVVRSSN